MSKKNVKQTFQFFFDDTDMPVKGYAIVGSKNETYDFVDYLSRDEVNRISNVNLENGLRFIYVIAIPSGRESDHVRWNIGETTDNAYGRYEKKTYWRHQIVGVFVSTLTDTEIHNLIKETSDLATIKHPNDENPEVSKEFVDIYCHEDCQKLLSYLKKWTKGETKGAKERQEIYEDTIAVGKEVTRNVTRLLAQGIVPHIGGNICCRGGKTNTNIISWLFSPARHMILTTYVGTVVQGYYDLIEGVEGYEHIMIVDATNAPSWTKKEKADILEKVEKHLNENKENRVLWIVPLTGTAAKDDDSEKVDWDDFDNTFDNRTAWIISFLNDRAGTEYYAVSNDEVDFGSTCPKQVTKINKLCKIGGIAPIYKMSLSGTNAHKAEKVWGPVNYSIDKDYIELRKIVEENLKVA